jgi:ribosomal protein L25 (general stress protein Ctc)
VRSRRPPSQGWKTFLHNHADGIASTDLARKVKWVLATAVIRTQSGITCDHMDEYAFGIAVEGIPKRGRIHEQLPIVLVGREIE